MNTTIGKWQYEVNYSYSSSPNAVSLGFAKEGCWAVSKRRKVTSHWIPIKGFISKLEAKNYLRNLESTTTYHMKNIRVTLDRIRRLFGIRLPERCQRCGKRTGLCCLHHVHIVPICARCHCTECGCDVGDSNGLFVEDKTT